MVGSLSRSDFVRNVRVIHLLYLCCLGQYTRQGDYITGKTNKPAITLEEFNEIDRLLKEEGPKVGRRLEKQFDQHAKD